LLFLSHPETRISSPVILSGAGGFANANPPAESKDPYSNRNL
jgi:hypothetical protein